MAVKRTVAFIFLLFLSSLYFASSKEEKCEQIKIPMCQSIGYSLTSMPNMFNHNTQEEAALEVHHFWPLVEMKCSPDIRFFLCSMYVPMCQPDFNTKVPPCRSICNRARKGCAPFMGRYRPSWPKRMRCINFPKGVGDGLCWGEAPNVAANHTFTTRPTEFTKTKATSKKRCEQIKIPMCQNIAYNLTSMPNIFNHDTQEEAALEVHQFWPLVEIKCSPDLRLFLCSVYAPMCRPNFKEEVPPCRSVCKRARKGCGPLMRKYGLSWPERMRCEKFPKEVGDGLCLSGAVNVEANHSATAPTTTAHTKTAHIKTTTPTELNTKSTTSKKKCEQIKVPMCQNIGYNLTHMPNMFNHGTQEEAALEVNHFWPLTDQWCSPDLKYFLCSVYAPMCQPNITRRVPPCRSLCKSARKACLPLAREFGLSWPKRMRCWNFPKRGSGQLCIGSKGIPAN